MDKGIDEKMLLARAADALKMAERQQLVKAFGFLTPAEAVILKRHLPRTDMELEFFGGYEGAERQLFTVRPEYYDKSELFSLISVIEITGRTLSVLSHRDYLGSILGLGINRDKIGDILPFEDRCLVFVLADIADFIVANLEKIGNSGVKLRIIDSSEIEIPKRKTEDIYATVASLRLDCIVAAMLRTSRAKALPYISGGRVNVNWEEKTDPSFSVKEGDVFSVRGTGRFVLAEVKGETKKGRVSVCIEKML